MHALIMRKTAKAQFLTNKYQPIQSDLCESNLAFNTSSENVLKRNLITV